MKITCCCCTYKRPKMLAWMIHCFERQTHPDRELIILDDAGQYEPQQGDRWRIISQSERFPTLGEKRNACAALASSDADAFAPWDDDDLYLPQHLEASAAALERGDWSRPSLVLYSMTDWTFRQYRTGGMYHAGMAYRRDLFYRAGMYPAMSGAEDKYLFEAMEKLAPVQVDPAAFDWAPSYIYASAMNSNNLSSHGCNQTAYDSLSELNGDPSMVVPTAPPWFDLDNPIIHPEIFPRPW